MERPTEQVKGGKKKKKVKSYKLLSVTMTQAALRVVVCYVVLVTNTKQINLIFRLKYFASIKFQLTVSSSYISITEKLGYVN